MKTTLNLTIIAASLSLRAIAQQSPAVTSGTLIEFDPGAGTASVQACAPNCGTVPQANNALGQITGYYTDANVVPHGFPRKADGKGRYRHRCEGTRLFDCKCNSGLCHSAPGQYNSIEIGSEKGIPDHSDPPHRRDEWAANSQARKR